MNLVNYYPCNKHGVLRKGYCLTRGSITSYLEDCRIWKSWGIKYVCLNGIVHSLA